MVMMSILPSFLFLLCVHSLHFIERGDDETYHSTKDCYDILRKLSVIFPVWSYLLWHFTQNYSHLSDVILSAIYTNCFNFLLSFQFNLAWNWQKKLRLLGPAHSNCIQTIASIASIASKLISSINSEIIFPTCIHSWKRQESVALGKQRWSW